MVEDKARQNLPAVAVGLGDSPLIRSALAELSLRVEPKIPSGNAVVLGTLDRLPSTA